MANVAFAYILSNKRGVLLINRRFKSVKAHELKGTINFHAAS